MKNYFYVFIIIVFCTRAFAQAQSPFEGALLLLDSGNYHDAYKLLEAIPSEDKNFVDAITELQKIHYRKQEWNKFFAYAQFYRNKIVPQSNAAIQARMISLEAMALAKHCYWDKAEEIIDWAIKAKERFSKSDYEEILDTKTFVQLQNKFPGSAKAQTSTVKAPLAFTRKQIWKIDSKLLSSISHPKFLSVNLKSECKL